MMNAADEVGMKPLVAQGRQKEEKEWNGMTEEVDGRRRQVGSNEEKERW